LARSKCLPIGSRLILGWRHGLRRSLSCSVRSMFSASGRKTPTERT